MLNRLLSCVAMTLSALYAQDGVIDLNHWKVKAGDNPAWAAPDLEQRDWTATGPPRAYINADSAARSIRWYRTRVPLVAAWSNQSLAIALPDLDEAYEVFVDGVRVGGIGAIAPAPVSRFGHHAAYPLPQRPAPAETMSIAIRSWAGQAGAKLVFLNAAGQNAAVPHPPRLGPAGLLQSQEALHRLQGERAATPRRAGSYILLLVGILSWLLFLEQRGRREYLWLGLAMGSLGLFPLAGVPEDSLCEMLLRSLQHLGLGLAKFSGKASQQTNGVARNAHASSYLHKSE